MILGMPAEDRPRPTVLVEPDSSAIAAHQICSLSPELFFSLDGDRLTTRPMKGTARADRRGPSTAFWRSDLAEATRPLTRQSS